MNNSSDQAEITMFHQFHSSETQEILGRPPHWILHWGLGICFILMVILLLSTWFISYPDIIKTNFILTSSNAPRKITARNDGKIVKLLVNEGDTVISKQPLIWSESTVNHTQALELESELNKLYKEFSNNNFNVVLDFYTNNFNDLGDLQSDFQTFDLQLRKIKSVIEGGANLIKIELLLKDIDDLLELEKNLLEQFELQEMDYQLALEEFQIHEYLFNEKVLSRLEFNKEKTKLLNREMPLKQLKSFIIQNRTSQSAKRKEILEIENNILDIKAEFLQSILTLQSQIASWKQVYILSTPVDGVITFSTPLYENVNTTLKQELMIVSPIGNTFIGILKVPQLNLGKLREGQSVIVKLNGYPYQEFGIIDGVLTHISTTPGRDSLYWAYVTLPKGLVTRYGHSLEHRNEMNGSAEIITSDRRLIERLLLGVRLDLLVSN